MLFSNPLRALCAFVFVLFASPVCAADEEDGHPLADIPLRSIGPALTTGRVADFAFLPGQWQKHYVAMASGNLWKTENNGVTWTPVFEHEGAYALGVVELDPARPSTVWVGTGENNSQRSVGYGDGVYKSMDGGKSWNNVGLKNSGHISMIRIHPDDSDVVWVAAQGPLWNSGGDRGLYKTTDGGQSWERILHVDDDTGVNEFIVHPADPDVMVASSYQRRRHVWTLINGGPGSGIHKTTDGGKTWREVTRGVPEGDLGRIGLAMAPSQPNVLYAIIEADEDGKGVYRSTDFGESWEKRSDHMTSSPQYYNELYVDPNDAEVLYSVDTFTHRSEDGGKTWNRLSIESRHVDDHALWIDPANSDHIYIGGDGGVYESWDYGETWRHVGNLPTVQFYRATPDNDTPFYNVCAGTQDNLTQCGPSRNVYTDGITNADWWFVQFGDGFKAQIDPTDPNIIYAQYQYGGLARFDKVTGERLTITPQPDADEKAYKWNWNAPLIISPHDPHRLYYGAEKLFRSDDRGESWTVVSPDLSRGLDRNRLEVMGRVWGVDTIAKNMSTSMYGALIAIAESPLVEGLLYAGTDDGLIQVSSDGGANWTSADSFRGVPDMSLIEDIIASRHDADVAYAVIDNHKRGDFKPYVLKTSNRGRSWDLISGDLPARGSAHTIAEDHVDPDLLFVGTEFGVFFSNDGGEAWNELSSLPTIAVRDIEIQRRETDLVVGTFGRGVYILDDYSPLRFSAQQLAREPVLFEPRDAWLYVEDGRRGWGEKGDFGTDRYTAENPPYGAVFSYYLPEGLQTLKEQRRAAEAARAEAGEDTPYPSWDALRREDREEAPSIMLTVRDSAGNVVQRLSGRADEGFHRVAWNMRYPAPNPVDLAPSDNKAPWESEPQGPMAIPGEYTVTLAKRVEGQYQQVSGPQRFALKPMFTGGLVTDDRDELLEFQRRTADMYRAVMGAARAADEIDNRIDHMIEAVLLTPGSTETHATALRRLKTRMLDVRIALSGDTTIASRQEPVPMPLVTRVATIAGGTWNTQAGVTGNFRDSYQVAAKQLAPVLDQIRSVAADLAALEEELEAEGAPWTPSRIPDWRP